MIHINFLGLEIFAKDSNDISTAIVEMMQCFIIASEKFGRGFEIEFKELLEDKPMMALGTVC